MSDIGPIFVVGPSRSGTTLMWSIVNAHPDVAIAAETHYFDDLRVALPDPGAALDGDERRRVEDHFLALTHRPYGHDGDPELGWMDRAGLRDAASAEGGSADDYFDVFVTLWAAHHGGRVVGEKTPRHVFRIDDILGRYPAAKIVVMVRDPRGVVASYKDWRHDTDPDEAGHLADEVRRTRASYDPVLLTMLWRAQARAGLSARARHGDDRVRVVRYETLTAEPDRCIDDLTRWLGLDFAAAQLEVPLHNSSYQRDGVERGVLTAPVDRWRATLGDADTAIVEMVAGSMLRDFDYAPSGVSRLRGSVAARLAGSPVRAVRSVAANRDRMGNPVTYIGRRLRAALGG